MMDSRSDEHALARDLGELGQAYERLSWLKNELRPDRYALTNMLTKEDGMVSRFVLNVLKPLYKTRGCKLINHIRSIRTRTEI
jgi:hypothetical protein